MSYSFNGNNQEVYANHTPSAWQAATVYAVGDKVKETATSRVHVCETAGTSGGSEPTWATGITDTTADNGISWRYIATSSKGMMARAYDLPLTFGYWLKRKVVSLSPPVWAIQFDYATNLGVYGGGIANPASSLFSAVQASDNGNGTYNYWLSARANDATQTAEAASVPVGNNYTPAQLAPMNNTWMAVLCSFDGSGDTVTSIRCVVLQGRNSQHIETTGLTHVIKSGSRIASAFIGESVAGSGDLGSAAPDECLVGHWCLWKRYMSEQDGYDFGRGIWPSRMYPSDVIAHIPMESDLVKVYGSDAMTGLTSEGAVLVANDNPPVNKFVSRNIGAVGGYA